MKTFAVLIAAGAGLIAQQPPVFEVAAIRPDLSGVDGTRINTPDGGRLTVTNYTLKALIRRAYDLQDIQITGAPGWLDSDRYDIEALAGHPEKISPTELKSLLQNLLADRFQLRVHRDTRELACYTLVVDKGEPKLRAHAGTDGSSMNDRVGPENAQLTAANVSMALLANYLGKQLNRVVLDSTSLTGGFDFTLEWSPEQAAEATGPSIFAGLREQLGLMLETRKGPVEVIVIDHVERPSEN